MRVKQLRQTIIVFTLLILVGRTLVPYIADHNETALPIPGGLSFRLHHAGRTYLNVETCAGQDWCSGHVRCLSIAQLDAMGHTPLVPIGAVPTFLGSPHPLFSAPDNVVPHPTVDSPTGYLVVVDHEGCNVIYVISGSL